MGTSAFARAVIKQTLVYEGPKRLC